MSERYAVAMTADLDEVLRAHLARADKQEDACFVLWFPSQGARRLSALLHTPLLPAEGERIVRGNVRLLPPFFERAIASARSAEAGLALLHSHIADGWQGLSEDDENAEAGNAAAVLAATGFPLVGLTLATEDRTWSARFWVRATGRAFDRRSCESVRVVGERLRMSYDPDLRPAPRRRPQLLRTIDAWGPAVQAHLARARTGVIGTGSVGSIDLEGLARMGMTDLMAMDFDGVKVHNQDRSFHLKPADVGAAKVATIARELPASATAERFTFEAREDSVCEDAGFRAALDMDVLFSCVDRPWPRSVLNFIAYAHLIPVIDGGVAVSRTPQGTMRGADWRALVATHGHRCMECVGQYDAGNVQTDREGHLDDPTYIERLPEDHILRTSENVMAFSMAVASLELLQFIQLLANPAGIGARWAQTYHFPSGLSDLEARSCEAWCAHPSLEARGDRAGHAGTGRHRVAEEARGERTGR